MSKKHFIILAAEIAKIEDKVERSVAAVAVARACTKINPAFDHAKFLIACNVII